MMKRFLACFFMFCSLQWAQALWAQDTTMTADDMIQMNQQIIENEQEPTATETTTSTEEATTSDSIYVRNISNDTWSSISSDKDFIYTVKKQKAPKKLPNLSWLVQLFHVLKYFLYALIAAVVIYIIYYILTNSEFSYFKKGKPAEEIPSGTYEDVYTYNEWDKALQDAIAQGNYRLAVRILYLQSLQKLHLAQHIAYQQEKTNWDYVNQLQNTSLQPSFIQLTKYFDYIWYGHFSINEARFRELQEQFKQFQNVL